MMKEYSNSHMEHIIDEYIHKKRDRLIMKLHYIDGWTAEEIAAHKEVDLSPRWVYTILDRRLADISKFLWWFLVGMLCVYLLFHARVPRRRFLCGAFAIFSHVIIDAKNRAFTSL